MYRSRTIFTQSFKTTRFLETLRVRNVGKSFPISQIFSFIIIPLPILAGGKRYEIKGCAGTGGFAQVYKAYVDGNPEDVVALKVRKILTD